ncbi:type 2 periplasmic-binding domain-containing protein [Algicola sagamiensis]|uniref:hypothetical protein n=1 Tax=Algicola sagamiensis TaxID=163869 RepID=UPI00037447A8|nr:hypothetical protein [Algicola sagamiensis]
MYRLRYFIGFFLLFAHELTAKPMVIAQHEDSEAIEACYTLIQEAYKKLDTPLQVISYPGRRGLHAANLELIDGDLCRIADMTKEYPNLIQLETPLMVISIVAVSKLDRYNITQIQDLKPYSLVSIRGMKAAEKYFQEFTISYVSDFQQSLAMLDRGLVDLAILPLRDAKRANSPVIIHQPPLIQTKLYHYLHKKYDWLQPKLDKILRSLIGSAEKKSP